MKSLSPPPPFLLLPLLLLIALSSRVESADVSYAGYTILEVVPRTDAEVKRVVGWVDDVRYCSLMSEMIGRGEPADLLCDRSGAKLWTAGLYVAGIPT